MDQEEADYVKNEMNSILTIVNRVQANVQAMVQGAPIVPPDPPVTPPVNPNPPIDPNIPLDYDFGNGGGYVHRQWVNPGQIVSVAFNMTDGVAPSLSVFAGTKFYTEVADCFPQGYQPWQTKGALMGTQADYADLSKVPKTGRIIYQVMVNGSGELRMQYNNP